jgi:hypothetical protein
MPSDFCDKSNQSRLRSACGVVPDNANQIAHPDFQVTGVAIFAHNFNSHGFHEWERGHTVSFNSHLSLGSLASGGT